MVPLAIFSYRITIRPKHGKSVIEMEIQLQDIFPLLLFVIHQAGRFTKNTFKCETNLLHSPFRKRAQGKFTWLWEDCGAIWAMASFLMQYKISQKFAPNVLHKYIRRLRRIHFTEICSISIFLKLYHFPTNWTASLRFKSFQFASLCLQEYYKWLFIILILPRFFLCKKFLFFNWLEFVFFRVFQKNQTRIVFSGVGLDWIGGTFCSRLNRDIFTQTYSNTTGRISVELYIFVCVHLCIVLIFEYL